MLDAKILEELKQQLLQKKEELETKLNEIAIRDEAGNWEAKYIDQGRDDETNANEVEDWANRTSVVEVLVKDLEAINLALKKMTNGTYGKCEVCGTDIPVERLKVMPEARTCAKCTLS